MSLKLFQATDDGTNGIVTPIADARVYALATCDACGITSGAKVTLSGSNGLLVADGYGIIHGRSFEIESETVQATLATSGTLKGRLVLRIDLASDSPITWVTQAASTLPSLTQENLAGGGSVYELPMATYTVSTTAVSNLINVFPTASSPAKTSDITSLKSTLTTNVSTLQSSIDATNSNVSSVQGSVDTLRCYLICLRSANWSSSAPYTQTVSVTGMTSGWVPGIPFVWDPGTVGWAKTQIDNALAYLTMIESASGSLTFCCAEDKPTSDLWIAVPGVIEWGTGWYGV